MICKIIDLLIAYEPIAYLIVHWFLYRRLQARTPS